MEDLQIIPSDVWLTIFDYLSDYDVIALSGLSQELRDFFNDPVYYTQRFILKWTIHDGRDIDLSSISREIYISICHEFDTWKQSVELINAKDIRLDRSIFRDIWELTFLLAEYKCPSHVIPDIWRNGYCGTCVLAAMQNRKNISLPLVYPTKWFNDLHCAWLRAQTEKDRLYRESMRRWNARLMLLPNRVPGWRRQPLPRAIIYRELYEPPESNMQIRERHTRRNSHLDIRFNTLYPSVLFSRFERKLARRYLRQRYLEERGQIIVYANPNANPNPNANVNAK